jgi:2-succinyl-6-hydroxy-2,4-cyclohexadiene-1-carboxylate synthase
MSTIDLSGILHSYDLTPATPSPDVLVFIHGWLLSRQYWHPVIEQLASCYQCLSYDLRGFGSSYLPAAVQEVLPSVSYSLASYAQDLGQLLEKLNLSRVWLVGHSLGGSIALWGAYQFPDWVQGVICINAGGGIYLKQEFDRFRTVGQQIVKLRPRWLTQIPGAELLFLQAGTVRSLSRTWAKQRLIDFVTAHPDAALGALLESTTEAEVHRLPQLVAKLHQPLYFIAGAQDSIMEPQYVRHLASFHPLFQASAANVFEIPECGHLAMLEQPQAVAEIIQTILENQTAAPQALN